MGRTPAGHTRERVFRYVVERLREGRPPTIREVQERFGFRAVQTAHEHLERLVKERRLEKDEGTARGYRLPGRRTGSRRHEPRTMLVPLLGHVQAGAPSFAVEDLEGYLPVTQRSKGDIDTLFGLRVHGESMLDAGILPGDIVVVRKQATARSGEIVVALWDDEATVKVLRKKGRRIELHPCNDDFAPIVPLPGSPVHLLGRVIEVRRYLGSTPDGIEAFGFDSA